MKTHTKFILLFAALFAVINSNAAVYTVNNIPTSTIAQFSTIQAAINVCAASGDTVLVHGSPNQYSGFNILNKSIVVIGPGWDPDKNPGNTVYINSASTIIGVTSSNSEMQGIYFGTSLTIGDNSAAQPANIRLTRNRFENSVGLNVAQSKSYSGYVFEGNVFINSSIAGFTTCTYQNFVFQNNYFCRNIISGFNNPVNTLIFDHNLWFGPLGGTDFTFQNCAYLVITNNIFVRINASTNNSFSTFSNNITFLPGGSGGVSFDTPWLVNSNLNGGGNVANQDPQMVAQSSINAGTYNPILDFTIAAGPANNSASDGKDMGLLYDATGSLNWTNSRNSRLPRVYNFVINNPTIPAGGTLNITVEGRKSN